ncbi:carbohydrate sulfotransferase 12 isoform X4 [Oryzias latipes]|uniref:carbohydrate sulfotransferase 12 isoform X4 n=1 Tax=Oryzias latipes TaxID=8090 RepID=UPI0005CB952F|nr:carbohydrate sulfotransferase 12 isoform X4 [Oryzias latipes]
MGSNKEFKAVFLLPGLLVFITLTIHGLEFYQLNIAPKFSEQQRLRKDLLRKQCGGINQSLVNLNKIDLKNFIVDDKHGIIYCYIPKAKLKHYTKFLFVRDPFVRLISAYRDKMQKYDQYFYDGYVRVILQRFTNQRNLTVNYNVARKKGLRPSFYNFIQYIVDPRTQTYAFEPHWSQMYRLCHPCLIEYDFVGHQESLQEDAQELLKMVKLENDIKFPPSYENMTSADSVMDWFQSVPLEDRRMLYRIYEEDFQLFGYRRPTELLDD